MHESSNRQLLFAATAVVILVLAAGVVVLHPREGRLGANPRPSRTGNSAEGGADSVSFPLSHGKYENPTEALELSSDLSMSKMPVRATTDGIPLTVEIRSSSRCQGGDLDIIRDDLRDSAGRSLLFTIEPLDGDTSVPRKTKVLDPAAIAAGSVTHSFMLPVGGTPRHFGLFLCSSAFEGDGCQDKMALQLNELTLNQFVLKRHTPAPAPKVYFFAYLLLDELAGWTFGPELREEEYQLLLDRVRTLGNERGARRAIETARTYAMKLRSIPPTTKSGVMTLDLPRFDVEACRKLAVRKAAEEGREGRLAD